MIWLYLDTVTINANAKAVLKILYSIVDEF